MTLTNTRPQGGAVMADVLEAARLSGLRSYLHGVNATDARKLLTDFLAAIAAPASAQEAPTLSKKDLNKLLNDFARACALGEDSIARMAASKAIHEYLDAAFSALAATAAPSAAVQQGKAPLSANDLADLQRLNEVFEDGQGWDIPAERMKRLSELGVVRWHGRTHYSITAFGMLCLGEGETPLRTVEEVNAEAHAQMLDRNGITSSAALASAQSKIGAAER
jgi:hypothetical protein